MLTKDVNDMQQEANDESLVWQLAGECLKKIDAAGGIGSHKDGQVRVTKAMLHLLGEGPK